MVSTYTISILEKINEINKRISQLEEEKTELKYNCQQSYRNDLLEYRKNHFDDYLNGWLKVKNSCTKETLTNDWYESIPIKYKMMDKPVNQIRGMYYNINLDGIDVYEDRHMKRFQITFSECLDDVGMCYMALCDKEGEELFEFDLRYVVKNSTPILTVGDLKFDGYY